jgi:capsule polysaccharide export protein KpsE/RkpR
MNMPSEVQVNAAVAEAHPTTDSHNSLYSSPTWIYNLRVLWLSRILLIRIAGIAFVLSLAVAFVIPKMYVSQARIMPPETSGANSALFGALAGRSTGNDALGVLAMSLIGGHNNGALFVDLLESASVSNGLIARFQLRRVYHKRYGVDAAKVLARRTRIVQDKKSGVLTLSVRDNDPVRARDLTQAYLDELNILVNRTSRSSAHQERVFIESRLSEVRAKLSRAQEALSEFSSSHSAVDLKEQARATVESEAKLQGELIAAQSEFDSLEQVYGDRNVRVREAEARISSLKHELGKMGGSAEPLAMTKTSETYPALPYLPLRQVPRLAVPYADLFREVQVQETVYNLLTQQYEITRIQEAKDVPVVNIIDAPGIPEKKSFPPRALLSLGLTAVAVVLAALVLIGRHHWLLLDPDDPRRRFAREVIEGFREIRGGLPGRRSRT